jgi:hypothetical protein
MCLSCGCGQAWDNHDGYNHITLQSVLDAAKAAGIDPDDVVNNIENTYAGFVDHDFVDIDDPLGTVDMGN